MSGVQEIFLRDWTTLGIGGPARFFKEVTTTSELQDALTFAETNHLPVFVLGGGSNLVVSDAGFPGVVIRPLFRGIATRNVGERVEVTAGAGEDWDEFVLFTVQNNLAGMECLAGIPGLVGATPVQNVGAYGQEIADTMVSVQAFDRKTQGIVTIPAAECGFSYRKSRFNTCDAGRFVLLFVTFALVPNGSPTLKYADLKTYFGPDASPTLRDVYHAVREIRRRKGMVVDSSDPDTRSAGSFFKNPVLTIAEYERLQARHPAPVPSYPQADGTVKVPAAWLIENAGFKRGQTFGTGRVGLSTRHVLALTNRGNATAHDLIDAARKIQAGVREKWNVRLVPEPQFLGFNDATELPDGAEQVVDSGS